MPTVLMRTWVSHQLLRPGTSAQVCRGRPASRSSSTSLGRQHSPELIGCLLVARQFQSGRLECDGISEWHPGFLSLVSTMKGCSKHYERFCQKYRHHSKGAPKCHWGSRMLKRLVETSGSRSKSKRISPGQMQLPFAFDLCLNQIPEEWHQIAVRFRRANGIRDGDRERSAW